MRRLLRKTRETLYLVRQTAGGRLLLTPRDGLEERILGVLGRARRLYPLQLHGFAFLPDRVQLLLTVTTRTRLAGFLAHLYRNITPVVHQVQGWDGPVFEGRGQRERVVSAAQARARLYDVHAEPVLRGLVSRPEEWPGPSSARALLGGVELVGAWNGAAYHVPVAPLPARLGGPVDGAALLDTIRASGQAMGRHWVRACEPTMPDPRDARFEEMLAC